MRALVLVVLGIPVVFALLGTLMKLFGFFHVVDPWTLANWQTVLGDDLFLRSLHNTFVLSIGTAVAAIVVHSLIAYIIARTPYAGRRLLDFVSWLPFTVPGIILGLALLWLFLGVGFLHIAYSTSKSGLLNFTRAAAMDLARHGIRVNSLTPTATDTQEAADRTVAWGRARPEPRPRGLDFPKMVPKRGRDRQVLALDPERLSRGRGGQRITVSAMRVSSRTMSGSDLDVAGRMMTRVAPASRNRRTRSRSAGWPCTEIVSAAGSRPASLASRSRVARLSRS